MSRTKLDGDTPLHEALPIATRIQAVIDGRVI